MRIKFSVLFGIIFMCVHFVHSQLHEMAHMTVGRIICGCWGTQVSFNLWQLCAECSDGTKVYWASMAGPMLSYLLIYFGLYLWNSPSQFNRIVSFTLVSGAFARLITAAFGSGDETRVIQFLFSDHMTSFLIKLTGFIIVFIFAFPPLFITYKRMVNKHKLWLLLGYCSIPLVIQLLYQFKFLDSLMARGILAEQHFMGIADMIHIHTLLVLLVLIVLGYFLRKKVKC